jgi:hypothetical protein
MSPLERIFARSRRESRRRADIKHSGNIAGDHQAFSYDIRVNPVIGRAQDVAATAGCGRKYFAVLGAAGQLAENPDDAGLPHGRLLHSCHTQISSARGARNGSYHHHHHLQRIIGPDLDRRTRRMDRNQTQWNYLHRTPGPIFSPGVADLSTSDIQVANNKRLRDARVNVMRSILLDREQRPGLRRIPVERRRDRIVAAHDACWYLYVELVKSRRD